MYTRIPVPQAILDFIREGHSFLVAGHHEPDGDCVGSQLALGVLLKRLHKKAELVSAGPWKRAEVMPFRDRFKAEVERVDRQDTRLLVVDCSSLDRTKLQDDLSGMPAAYLDHHQTSCEDGLAYINPQAPAAASLVLALWEAFEEPLCPEAAEYLLFGLCTDTGFFRHVDAGGAETLADAYKLAAAGGNLKKIFAAINGSRNIHTLKLMGTVLAGAESYYGGSLVIVTETMEETERFGRENRDSDLLYQQLLSIQGVEAVVVIRQDTQEKCAIGFRSVDAVDVSQAAAFFGGGGHKNAAGASAEGRIPEIKARVIALFRKMLFA